MTILLIIIAAVSVVACMVSLSACGKQVKTIEELNKQLYAQQRVIFHLYQSKSNINRQLDEMPK